MFRTVVPVAVAAASPWFATHSPWAGAALASAACVTLAAGVGLRGFAAGAVGLALTSVVLPTLTASAGFVAAAVFHGLAVAAFCRRGRTEIDDGPTAFAFAVLAGPVGAGSAGAAVWLASGPGAGLLAARAALVGGTAGGLVGLCLLAKPRPDWRPRLAALGSPAAALVLLAFAAETWVGVQARRTGVREERTAAAAAAAELSRAADALAGYRPRAKDRLPTVDRGHGLHDVVPAIVQVGGLTPTPEGWQVQAADPDVAADLLHAVGPAADEATRLGRVECVAADPGRILLVAPLYTYSGHRVAAYCIVDSSRLRDDWPARGVTLRPAGAGGPGTPVAAVGRDWRVAVPAPTPDPVLPWAAAALAVPACGLLAGLTGNLRRTVAAAAERLRELDGEAHARMLMLTALSVSRDRSAEANRLARVGYLDWNPVTGEADWSETVSDVLGRTPDGHFDTFLDAVPFGDRPAFTEWADGLVRTRGRGDYELRVLRPDGTEAWIAVGLSVPPGPELSAIASVQDISARKAAEAALRSSEEQFRRSFEAAAVGKALVGPDGGFIRVNAALCDFLGYATDDLLTRSLHRVTHPDDLHTDLRPVADCLAGVSSGYQMEKRYVRKDGAVVWGLLSSSVVRDAGGRPSHFICQIVDVTARKAAEQELMASEARLAEAQKLAQIGNWEWDPQAGRAWWSDNLYRLMGLEPLAVAPSHDAFLAAVHPEDRGRVADRMADIAGGTGPAEFDLRIVRPDGAVRWWHSEAAIDRDPAGRPRRVRGTSQDITDRKRAEERQREFDDRLRQSQKLESLGVLAGGIAHDFNNLLTGILGNANLAREAVGEASPVEGFLRPIEKAAQHAAELCQQMLAYAGKRAAVRGHFHLSALVAESADLLRLSVSKKIELAYDLAPDLPACYGDAGQIRQVLLNLVSNAGEAVGDAPGRIDIRTGTEYVTVPGGEVPPGEYVWAEVTDTGCGMEPAVAARIFDPFFTTKFTGRGLGLSAVHGIAKSHGGTVTLTTAPGRGTTFRVVLAAADGGMLATPPPHIHTPVLLGRPGPRPAPAVAGSAGVAVVADDEPTIRELAAITLRGLGFTVREARNGREAVDLVRAEPGGVRLVVLDMMMPELDGRRAAAAIRAAAPDTPVVVMSGYTEHDLDEPFDAGDVIGFVQKPFRPADLTACVRGALARTADRVPVAPD